MSVRWAMLLALAMTAARAVAAESAAGGTPPAISHSLSERGPLSLSFAAEPRGLHWGFATGFPLALAHGGASPWRVDAFVNASHDRESPGDASALATSLVLERADARGANWWGLSRGGPRTGGEPEARLRLAFGRLQSFSGVRAEAAWITSSVLFRNDLHTRVVRTPIPPDTGSGNFIETTVVDATKHAALWNTAQGTLRWERGRLALESVGGLSTGAGVRARRWAQASLELQLSRRVLMLASLGERPAPALAFRSTAQPRTMLGLEFAPWSARGWGMSAALKPVASALVARAVGGDKLLVRVHAHDVSRVELSGDFTDWTPVALMPVHANWWAGVVRVLPGVHRVQLRLDGGPWLAPPGLPRADDGPGGPSGTLLVAPAD